MLYIKRYYVLEFYILRYNVCFTCGILYITRLSMFLSMKYYTLRDNVFWSMKYHMLRYNVFWSMKYL